MKISQLAKFLEKLEETDSRNEMTEVLSDLFKKSDKKEIGKLTYLLLGSLAPKFDDVVFNIAETMMIQVLSEAYGADPEEVKALYKKKGDLGETAFVLAGKKGKRSKGSGSQGVTDVYGKLLDIALDEGEGSQERKINRTAKLLGHLDPLSAKYVSRIPVGKLRLGFSDKTVLDALSWMKKGDKSAKASLEEAYNVFPDVGYLAERVKEKGIKKATDKVKPKVGVPVLPMLAQRLKSPQEMIKKMEEVVVEPKFDGLRIQIHFRRGGFGKNKGKVKAYTRNLNETSWMFPELKEAHKYISADEVILDSEAVGIDEKRRSIANFQKTMTRRRKHEITEIAEKVGIKFYVFDILLKDGKNLMNAEYVKRRKVLEKTVKKGKLFEVVDFQITKDPGVITELMREELGEGMEGIIVKRADSKYVAGRTGWRWVKMKEEESSKAKLADTVDCIVMGYYRGRGKRAKFGIGGFLVGVTKGEEILTLTKIGTGLTDEQFKELKERLNKLEVKSKPKEYGRVAKSLVPDVWVEPSLVVEIAADDITKSPTHSSGYALRFPRLVKFRDDKSTNQATTHKEAEKLFKLQASG